MKSKPDSLRYPTGKFEYGKTYSHDETRKHIKTIARLPKELKKALKRLHGGELDLSYRRGGWTARQVVHHIADSHMNAYVRMKLAVTEQTPIIKPYEEANWAETEDAKNAPVKLSLKLLAPLHRRWVMFLESLSEEELERGYFHPEIQRVIPLPEAIALYAWHGQHHVAHIRLVAGGKAHRKKEDLAQASGATRRKGGQKAQGGKAEVASAKAEVPKASRAEILAKARAARAAKKAQQVPAKAQAPAPKRTRRSKAEVAAEKAAKAQAPKANRAEILAKARAARAAKKAQQSPAKAQAPAPKRTRRSKAEVAAEKAAKASGEPKKRRGMSPEHMAKIREARMAKRAAAIATGAIAPPKPKPASDAPKRSREEILAAARAARAAKRTAEASAPKAKAESPKRGSSKGAAAKAAKTGGETKRRGMSPEHMAKIRAMRGKKK